MKDTALKIMDRLATELRDELLDNILSYWTHNTPDRQHGGFIGSITVDNKPEKEADKGAVLHARLLWTYSACYREFQDPEMLEMADHAYQFLINHFVDQKYGGVYWKVSFDGKPTDERKHVYAQSFFIYGLSEYYAASGNNMALKHAVELFELVEEKCSDTVNGGYFEAYARDWILLDDVRLSEVDMNEPKSMNTHLHVLEAYTNLYRYYNSDLLTDKLYQLIRLYSDHILNVDKNSVVKFMSADWTPRSDGISWGHDIESSWLLLEAAEISAYPDIESIRQFALNLAEHTLQSGQDNDGGIINESGPEGNRDTDKDWWAQAEAIVGFTNAYQLSGDINYLKAAEKNWEFIRNHVVDRKYGEWYEKTNREGEAYELHKVRSWKCPYHNSRAALELIRRSGVEKKKFKRDNTNTKTSNTASG